jgi:hypothetical protein
MTDQLSSAQLKTIEERHYPLLPTDKNGQGIANAAFEICPYDDEIWPCDAIRLIDELRRIAPDNFAPPESVRPLHGRRIISRHAKH